MNERREDASAASADRMAERDAATTDVQAIFGNAERLNVAQNLRRERFTDFRAVDIGRLRPVPDEEQPDAKFRRVAARIVGTSVREMVREMLYPLSACATSPANGPSCSRTGDSDSCREATG